MVFWGLLVRWGLFFCFASWAAFSGALPPDPPLGVVSWAGMRSMFFGGLLVRWGLFFCFVSWAAFSGVSPRTPLGCELGGIWFGANEGDFWLFSPSFGKWGIPCLEGNCTPLELRLFGVYLGK